MIFVNQFFHTKKTEYYLPLKGLEPLKNVYFEYTAFTDFATKVKLQLPYLYEVYNTNLNWCYKNREFNVFVLVIDLLNEREYHHILIQPEYEEGIVLIQQNHHLLELDIQYHLDHHLYQ